MYCEFDKYRITHVFAIAKAILTPSCSLNMTADVLGSGFPNKKFRCFQHTNLFEKGKGSLHFYSQPNFLSAKTFHLEVYRKGQFSPF